MNLMICKDKQECGAEAAKFGAERIRQAIAEKGECRIILATGASQFEMQEALLKEEGIDWTKVTMFHLDEYVGLPVTHPASFRKYLTERFVEKLPVKMKEVNLVNGEAEDLRAFCDELGAKLQEKPIDVAFIGIGENGHIAFNDPPVADFHDSYLVKKVELDMICRMQQVHDGCFPTLDDVPKYALTLTVPALMSAKTLICTVPAKSKAQAVKAMLEGTCGEHCPATALRFHDNAKMFLDADSASEVL